MSTRAKWVMDIECYVDYFLVCFACADDREHVREFEMYPPYALDVAGVTRMLESVTACTFNGNSYDMPMLSAALLGYDCAQLKWLSDQIIQEGLRPWDIERQYNIRPPSFVDHVDLIEIMPGQHGLKMYMAKMHSPRIQELPLPPESSIAPEMRPVLRQYCRNDLNGTIDAVKKFSKEIALRESMSAEYGIDLRSKSDAQIAEAVIKHELGFYVERPTWAVGTWFNYDPPAFLAYQTPMLQELLRVVRNARFVIGPNAVEMPPELDSAKIKIGNSTYRLGIGGLHSSESSAFHVADAVAGLQDVDVASFYPKLMLNSGAFPPQMGPAFIQVFNSIVERRLAAKAAGDKSTADSLKITINGTFGKTLSKWGILSAPKLGIQTTITGQLSLLMLIEMLELCGIPVVSANTDGIVIKCPRALEWLRDQVVADWERRTGLQTEANDYAAIYSRDVNNYIAVKAKDYDVKLKGEYAPPVPVGGSWPNPGGEVCVDAIIAYLKHGTPLADTIRACRDVRKFVYVRTVTGGGVKYYGNPIESAKTKRGMREQLAAAGWMEADAVSFGKEMFFRPSSVDMPMPMKDAHKLAVQQLRDASPVKTEYLGKVVRWYYAAGEPGAIRYKTSGNLVPKTEGARPMMELPHDFAVPADVDFDWYVREAKSMITDMGVAMI